MYRSIDLKFVEKLNQAIREHPDFVRKEQDRLQLTGWKGVNTTNTGHGHAIWYRVGGHCVSDVFVYSPGSNFAWDVFNQCLGSVRSEFREDRTPLLEQGYVFDDEAY